MCAVRCSLKTLLLLSILLLKVYLSFHSLLVIKSAIQPLCAVLLQQEKVSKILRSQEKALLHMPTVTSARPTRLIPSSREGSGLLLKRHASMLKPPQ